MEKIMARPRKKEQWEEDLLQENFDDLLYAEERKAWVRRKKCKHCYVWGYSEEEEMFFIACVHGCGSVRHKWRSQNKEKDMSQLEKNKEAYIISHAQGCPRIR
jgi:hypothetical protein